jgi:cytidyltransferase-like protein
MCADLFHYGHVNLLKAAKKLGDILIVGIHSDSTIESYKRKPIMNMKERITVVEACKYVDEVIPDEPLVITQKYIMDNNINVVAHAHQESENKKYSYMYKIPYELGIFRRLEYTDTISTTDIINRLKNL